MGSKYKFLGIGIFIVTLAVVFGAIIHGHPVSVLDPAGPIAYQQRNLIIIGVLLSLIIVVPVFGLTFFIAWKYRADNDHTPYNPDWDHSRVAETVWWFVPSALIAVIAVLTWQSSHQLDPSKPINSTVKPLTVQVVALDWKWLFIYPEQHVASVNLLEFPEKTPVNFQITADAPMNSFWIPQLGGQIYAMSGMSTQLHLMADHLGDYRGSSANISGQGFAGMHFTARASTQTAFAHWVSGAQHSAKRLNMNTYANLAKPSQSLTTITYSHPDSLLYNSILMKYMMPGVETNNAYPVATRTAP